MSVLIKGIEMPTDHPLWIIVHSDGTIEANEVSASRPVGWQTLRNAAVPVPPHGRVIDGDALEAVVEAHYKHLKISRYDRDLLLHYLDVEMAPTIIPAEK